jgi:hypothetical protein
MRRADCAAGLRFAVAFMRTLTVLATCGALVYHLVAGCCTHHSHGRDMAGCGQVAGCASHVLCHEHGEEHRIPGEVDGERDLANHATWQSADADCRGVISDSGSHPTRCNGASCTYLPPSKVLPPALFECGLGAMRADWWIAQLGRGAVALGQPRDWFDTGPAKRAHLLKCVLLV